MDKEEIIRRLKNISRHAVHVVVEPPFIMSLDDGIALDDAVRLLKEQNWISVRDRLPNCNGCYLVWRPRFYHDKGMPSICYFDGSNTWHDSYGVDFTRTLAPDDVSHWMPLPEQPCKKVKRDD